jgi:hypothetical protein
VINCQIRASYRMTFPLIIVNFNHFFIQPAPDRLHIDRTTGGLKHSSAETSESFILWESLRPSEKMAMSKGIRVGTITIGCSLLVLTFFSMICGSVAMSKMSTPIAVSIGLWGLYVSITFHSVFSLTFAFLSN